MKLILFIDTWLEKIAGWLLVFLLGLMIIMAFGQVVLRNFFHSSIEWGDIFLRHLVLWLGWLGAVIATGEGRHLRIEFLSKLVPAKIRKIFSVIGSIFAAGICVLLTQAAVSFVQLEIESAAILILDLPSWYFIIILPIGYAMVAFRFLVRALVWSSEIMKGNWHMAEAHY